ncbi:MAG TPA: transcriptional regulator, partial [Porticoccaceae bacterium]|nr:transcriptional regulator [Porticoccaceae bacterium]
KTHGAEGRPAGGKYEGKPAGAKPYVKAAGPKSKPAATDTSKRFTPPRKAK